MRPLALVLVLTLLATPFSAPCASRIPDVQNAIEHTTQTPAAFKNPRLEPHWLRTGNAFWFKQFHPDGTHHFVLVDCQKRSVQPAFDHEAIASALSTATRSEIRKDALPISQPQFSDEGSLQSFTFKNQQWTKSGPEWIASGTPTPATTPRIAPTERSLLGGPEVNLSFHNRTDKPLRMFWIDNAGKARPYATIPPGTTHQQHTFVGHVWHLVSPSGQLFAAFRASLDHPEITLDATPTQPLPQPPAPPSAKAFIQNHNVFWQSQPNTPPVPLTLDGTPDNAYSGPLILNPDQSHLLCLRRKPEQKHTVSFVEASPDGQIQPKLHQLQYLKPGDRIADLSLTLIDIPAKTATPVATENLVDAWSIDHLRWIQALNAFTALYNRRGHQEQRVVAIEPSGKVRSLIHETSATFIDYSQKTILEWLDDGSFLWASERSGSNHLYRFSGQTGELLHPVTHGKGCVRRILQLDPPSQTAWLIVSGFHPDQDPYHIHLLKAALNRTEQSLVTAANGTHARTNHPAPNDDSLTLSPNHEFLVARWSRIDHPPVTELRDARSGALLLTLETADATPPSPKSWPLPETFSAPGRDHSTPIHGIIIRPSHFDPSKKYPVIEEIYAGPHGHFVPKPWSALQRQHRIAEMGAVVVQIDGMGTNWRSKPFHDVAWRNLNDAGFPDRIAWMKAAAKNRPWMDLSRVGIYGGSAGGQNALAALLHHGDFYRTAVADCGCHDNRMDKIWWNEAWLGLVGPWYPQNSNVTHAHKLQGNLLLIVGETDSNVDPASTMQVAKALIQADKDFELLVMPSTGHGAAETPYASRKRMEFLHKHLIAPAHSP
jgi:dipeptidyl-peptidase-4